MKNRFRIVQSQMFKDDRPWLLIDRQLEENVWFNSAAECQAEVRLRLAADTFTEMG